MKDSADPQDGWSAEEVAATPSGPATADIYGKLFYYLQSILRRFSRRLSSIDMSFELLEEDAADLPRHLSGRFDRIEVCQLSTSRVADGEG